jgi:hypothetical protein
MLSTGLSLSTRGSSSRSSNDTVDILAISGEHERGILHRLPGISVITEWPHGCYVENLAAKHNGQLLVTVYSINEIYEVNPYLSKSNRTLLASLPLGPTGIIELDFNNFYVNVGTIGERNTWSIYNMNLNHEINSTIPLKKLIDIDSALFLMVFVYYHMMMVHFYQLIQHLDKYLK